MPTWKSIFLKAAGFGAGAVLTAAICIGMWVWYKSRPPKPKPWNPGAITAQFYRITSEEESKLEFEYVLENNTDKDYELQAYSAPKIAAKLEDTKSLTGFANQDEFSLKLPIFVPAHEKTRISITLPSYGFSSLIHLTNSSSDEEKKKYRAAIVAHVAQKMSNLNGFVLFDENNRYKIELPNGWKKEFEENERKSKEKQEKQSVEQKE